MYRRINKENLTKICDNPLWCLKKLEQLGFTEIKLQHDKSVLELRLESLGVFDENDIEAWMDKLWNKFQSLILRTDYSQSTRANDQPVNRNHFAKLIQEDLLVYRDNLPTFDSLDTYTLEQKQQKIDDLDMHDMLKLVPQDNFGRFFYRFNRYKEWTPKEDGEYLMKRWLYGKHKKYKKYEEYEKYETRIMQWTRIMDGISLYDPHFLLTDSMSSMKDQFSDGSKSDKEIRHGINQIFQGVNDKLMNQFKQNQLNFEKYNLSKIKDECKYNWQCYVCTTTNSNTDEMCHACNRSFNPLYFAKTNESDSFGVNLDKNKFGMCTVPAVFQNINGNLQLVANYNDHLYAWPFSWNGSRIIICFSIFGLEYRSNVPINDSIDDITQILSEVYTFFYNTKRPISPFKRIQQVQPLNTFIILTDKCRQKLKEISYNSKNGPIVLKYLEDFALTCKIQSRYEINVTNDDANSPKIYCDRNNYNYNVTQCPTITRCLQLIKQELESKNTSYNVNNVSKDEQRQILNHLSHFKHKELEEQTCRHNSNCQSLKNITDNKFTFLDQIHIHLYKHKLPKCARNRGKDKVPFEFASAQQIDLQNYDTKFTDNLLLELIFQVIDNGFENELIPVNESIRFDFNQWSNNFITRKIGYGDIVTTLSKHYKIFDVLTRKMNHPRHLKMRSPLLEPFMLSLILYTFSDKISHSLSCALIKRDYDKWCVLDYCLSDAITVLSYWENHDLFVYCGISAAEMKEMEDAAAIDYDDRRKQDRILFFQTYKSFWTSLSVAKEFAGDEGQIITIKLCPLNLAITKNIHACDVSWISKYVNQREILVAKNSSLIFDRTRIRKSARGKYPDLIFSQNPFEEIDQLSLNIENI